jgi:uncharacterized protein (TIGR00255 family)
MTGFGSGRARVDDEELTVELKSLNHKFCEVKARLPRELANLEPAVTKVVKDALARGAVEVMVKRAAPGAVAAVPQVDVALAREYQRALLEVARAIGAPEQIAVGQVASQPGVIRVEERGVNAEAAERALHAALAEALKKLAQMRRDEGQAIRADLEARLSLIESTAKEVEALSPRQVEEYRVRLSERIAEIARGVPLDQPRLVQEVAYFAERTDVAEEMTRLKSHLQQFRVLIASEEPAGRKMDFLVQEMHREVNTTGSKSQHPEISNRIVAMKAELERVREQVQNVE